VESTASATTVEATAAATTVEAAAHISAIAAAGESASNRVPAAVSAAIRHRTPITIAISRASVPIHGPSIVPAAIAVIAAAVSISAIPGASTNERSAQKPRRSVVPVRRAGIRIIAIIAISADRSRIGIAPIHRAANSNSNRNLSMRVGRSRHQQDTQ
jgi:hypothetical protein